MAKRAKFVIGVNGFDVLLERLRELNGDATNIAEKCLNKGHEIITPKAQEAAQKQNLPARGRYYTGKTLRSTKLNAEVEWKAYVAKEDVGYSINKGGLAWVFMLYGTPRYMKNKKMWAAFYGAKTKREVIEAQKKIFFEEFRKAMGV